MWLLLLYGGCGVLVILSLTWRLLGRHSQQLVDWRFDCDIVVLFLLCDIMGIWSWDWFLA